MNTSKLHAIAQVAASMVAGNAFADGAEYVYPQPVHAVLKRQDVHADAVAAARRGDTVSNEYLSHQYPQADLMALSTLWRAQVVAEAVESRRLGLIGDGERAQPVPTAAQAEQVRLAGQRAVSGRVVAGRLPATE